MRRDPDAFVIDSDNGRGIVGITHKPTGFRLHMLKSQVDPSVRAEKPIEPEKQAARGRPGSISFALQKAADENLGYDMTMGAAVGGALPALTHAKYELIDRHAMGRSITRLVDQAAREKILFAGQSTADWQNPLQKKMKLGDIILQSNAGPSLRDIIKTKMVDFGSLSLGASGGPFVHAAVSSRSGRAIDPGKEGVIPFKDAVLEALGKPRQLNRRELAKLWKLRELHPRKIADAKFLMQQGSDAFGSGYDTPNASVIMRPRNLSGVPDAKLQHSIADVKSVGYSKTDAVWAGLKRLLFPLQGPRMRRGAPDLSMGTFCSHGACTSQALRGLKTPSYSSVLPPDLLHVKNQDLVGIGINPQAMKTFKDKLKGLRGQDRLAEAAKLTMRDTLRYASNGRRILAGVLTGGLGLAGAAGGAIGNKLVEE